MKKTSVLPSKETRPERYLREIRDLQIQNNELLQKLSSFEEGNASRRHWHIGFKIAGMLLPYLFSIFVAWTFYAKVLDVFNSFTSAVVNIPSTVAGAALPSSLKDGVESGFDRVREGGAVIWDNKDELLNSGKNRLNEYIIR